ARFNFYYLRRGVNVPNRLEPNTVKRDTLVGFAAVDAPFPMVTYQENKLMRAELAVRANNFADGLRELNEYRDWLGRGGYINSVTFARSPKRYAAYAEADFLSGGMENADGSLTKEEALLREILEERYVTFYCQTVAWNDERRTRQEKFGVKLTPNIGNQLPWRFIYAQNELNGNALAPRPDPGVFQVIPIYGR
ncbi:MAG: SusD/RagB family nutrient-binding outer membrane lipoprotein, partial [Cytophagales bacterium]|nr:SusD/RagB family nutrient-binding outer membrane lipoprotein [Cytophagales bacterium]